MKTKIFFLALISCFSWGFSQTNCANAVSITAGTHTVPGITSGTAPISTCGLTSGSAGYWYKYTPTQNSIVTVSTVIPGQNVNTQVRVFGGTCNSPLNCISGNDDFSGVSSQISFVATVSTTYYIAFDNKWTTAGFDFKLSEEVRPTNLTFTTQSVPASGGYNNCVLDMNGDYLDDIVSVINATQIMISYQQVSGGFNNVTYTIPSTTILPTWSIAGGDYDNNGFNDLIYGSGSGIAFVKANSTGTGFTSDRKPQSFLVQRTNFIDINNDGRLDAFVCDDNAPNRYYMNDGTNLNHIQGGIGDFPSGGNYASTWIDYDNDGDLDMYLAKCSGGGSGPGGNINELHRNNGNGTFTNVAVAANMANPTQTWSSAWGDFNNDGWMDAVVGINAVTDGFSRVMKNNGDGTFTNVTNGSGYDITNGLSREYVAHDFDNDGFLDVLGAGNTIMFGNGNFKFTPNPSTINLDLYDRPIGDLNNDGFLDIQKGTSVLFNNGNTNKWLKVTLQGVQSNRSGIGARVEIYGTWGKQIRDVQSGTGFGNMSTLNTHFGIGQATAITKVIVKWPSGTVDTINNVTPNTTLFVKEGSTLGTNEVNSFEELFTVYPNPTDDVVNFITMKNFVPTQAKVYEVSGRLALSAKPENNSISIKNLKQGVYVLIMLDDEGNSYSQKIMKK